MQQALLVIDAQEIYTNPSLGLYCENADQTLNNINRLVDYFQINNLPVIYIKHRHKADHSDLGRMFDFAGSSDTVDFIEDTPDVEFSTGLKILENSTVVYKNRYSSFYKTDLERLLHADNVKQVVVCGFMTNFCCESAARDAHDRDFFVDFIIDATGTPGAENMDQQAVREAVTNLLSTGFAAVKTTDDYLAT